MNLPKPRWMYHRSKQLNGVKDCRECEGTGVYSPSLNPEYDTDCSVCRGEGVMDSVLFHDPLKAMHENRLLGFSKSADRYAHARILAMRPVKLPGSTV